MVVPARSGRFRVVEGRRRCNAITQLTEAREWSVPARGSAAPKTVQSPRARGGVASLSARAALVRVLAAFVFLADGVRNELLGGIACLHGGARPQAQSWRRSGARTSALAELGDARSSSSIPCILGCHVYCSPLVMGVVTTTTGGTAMLEKVFYTSVLVSDQDKALDFYTRRQPATDTRGPLVPESGNGLAPRSRLALLRLSTSVAPARRRTAPAPVGKRVARGLRGAPVLRGIRDSRGARCCFRTRSASASSSRSVAGPPQKQAVGLTAASRRSTSSIDRSIGRAAAVRGALFDVPARRPVVGAERR